MGSPEHSVNSLSKVVKLVLYTSSGCPKCMTLKKWLRDRDLEFGEKTMDTDVMADLIMRNIVVLSAPALEVGEAFYTEDQIFDGDRLVDAKVLGLLEGSR